jgi:hypothetical protein
MPPVGFEGIISASERPETHVLDRAATETGPVMFNEIKYQGLEVSSEMKIQVL